MNSLGPLRLWQRGLFYAGRSLCVIAFLPLILPGCTRTPLLPEKQLFSETQIFTSGEDLFHTFRIPALIATPQGTLLAFCEGRRQSRSDTGDIDLVLRRSFDNGKTWTPPRVIAEDAENTVGNPCPVIDQDTGTIWLLLTSNPGHIGEKQIRKSQGEGTRTVLVTKSQDDGATWAPTKEITQAVKPPDWTWYATGPGNGIQLKNGRLVVPCDHGKKDHRFYSHVIYSDDHGETWQLGGTSGQDTDESTVVELANGSLMINMRSNKGSQPYAEQAGRGRNQREIAISNDGGLTWLPSTPDPTLIEPVCQASLLRSPEGSDSLKNILLFSNPASTERVRMTVRLSYDEGDTWPIARLVHEGPSAYSSLTTLADGTIGLLYESGATHPYEGITFARFDLKWLLNGASQPH